MTKTTTQNTNLQHNKNSGITLEVAFISLKINVCLKKFKRRGAKTQRFN
jgi:hypothetical protein